jgi:hypothetical protein
MQFTPQPKNNFCDLSKENIVLLMRSQELLLAERRRRGLPLDGRGVSNMNRLKAVAQGKNA